MLLLYSSVFFGGLLAFLARKLIQAFSCTDWLMKMSQKNYERHVLSSDPLRWWVEGREAEEIEAGGANFYRGISQRRIRGTNPSAIAGFGRTTDISDIF